MTKYKEWYHFRWLMKANNLATAFKLLHETRTSLLLTRYDGYTTSYTTIIRTSDKCYRIVHLASNDSYPDRQLAEYSSVKELYQIVATLAQYHNTNNNLAGHSLFEPKKKV